MVAPNIFMTVPSGSHLLGTLVQARLQKVEQRGNTCRSETLDNLRATVDALASLSSTCTGVLDDIYSKGEEKDTATVLGEIGNVLEWNERLPPICPIPTYNKCVDPDLLQCFNILISRRLHPIPSSSSGHIDMLARVHQYSAQT